MRGTPPHNKISLSSLSPPKKEVKSSKVGTIVRFVTATSLFDGHDAAINVIRRILQDSGVEVIHLGHNRSASEVVTAAIQEDVHGIAVSSYQGGHIEFFKYLIDLLNERGASHIKVFGGGGGVIVADEIQELHQYGVARIYSPEDGQTMGLQGIIDDMLDLVSVSLQDTSELVDSDFREMDLTNLPHLISAIETGDLNAKDFYLLRKRLETQSDVPVIGLTGTGGAGKSSLTDEIVRRFRMDYPELKISIIAVDPSKRRSGGALLGDRMRMNAIHGTNIYMRSLATRGSRTELSECLPNVILACKAAGAELIIVETSGIGQGDAEIVPLVDLSIYAMTPEYGAPSQLEKIEMLDLANLVVINKFDRIGGSDALRDVRKQYQRNRRLFNRSAEELPVFGTIAAKYNDVGVTALYSEIIKQLTDNNLTFLQAVLKEKDVKPTALTGESLIRGDRVHYLSEISRTVREYHNFTESQVSITQDWQHLRAAASMIKELGGKTGDLNQLINKKEAALDDGCKGLIADWPNLVEAYSGDEYIYKVRDKEIRAQLKTRTICGTLLSRVALPKYYDEGQLLRWRRTENLPGHFPFTAGVFPFKRQEEDPTRMFAGEGSPARTNKRFKILSEHSKAKRLSTAFDSVTLYGNDPDLRPDIYGKVGNSGVSVATLDDMKKLYHGFDLCDPTTSVSMTINGPAPTLMAMFINTALDQQIDVFIKGNGRKPREMELKKIKKWVHENIRGTVQADILKEDQGQNTCLFSTDFSLKVMGDIQEYFIDNKVTNFYSVSISGYHIAEAGANPISQLAFTLANGFTYVESYIARGMRIDDFAPNLSFFFSTGMDPEYTVLGRVARRIWAITMRDKYGASERSQKLKYHTQTSGRSLHAQEYTFNDIRTTLQALIASYDGTNSLHTNAFDEAITTPSEESVRRAMAIQLIINREWGLAKNENPNQGSFIIDELTDLVEEAVLREFENLSERGGVLGAMETGYQRGKIQDESLYYETMKYDGSYPVVGVNTFLNSGKRLSKPDAVVLTRSTEDERQSQLKRLHRFQKRHSRDCERSLESLKKSAIANKNIFVALMDAVRVCSLGQITNALFEVGGQYRRNM